MKRRPGRSPEWPPGLAAAFNLFRLLDADGRAAAEEGDETELTSYQLHRGVVGPELGSAGASTCPVSRQTSPALQPGDQSLTPQTQGSLLLGSFPDEPVGANHCDARRSYRRDGKNLLVGGMP